MRRLYMISGFISVVCGAFLSWLAYGFASMVDPRRDYPPCAILCYHVVIAAAFRDVVPAELRHPPSRFSGADP